MAFVVVGLCLLCAVVVVQLVAWLTRGQVAAAVIGAAFALIYFVDLIGIAISGHVYLVASIGARNATTPAVQSAILMVLTTWVLFSIAVELISFRARHVANSLAVSELDSSSIRFVPFVLVGLGACLIVISLVLSAGIEKTLELRQSVFTGNPLGLLGYFVAPSAAVLAFLAIGRLRGVKRLAAILIFFGTFVATLLSGSRSSLFLSVVIPILFFVWRHLQASSRSVGRDALRLTVVLALVFVPLVGGSYYLATARGVSEDTSALGGSDISQSDALVSLIEATPPPEGGITYLAAITSFIPRDAWPGKPNSGGVESSLILTPDRYLLTGAQTTPGILGEAFINFGVLGAFPAALLMALLVAGAQRLLRSKDIAFWLLGVVVLVRGVNLLRGDLTNVVVPVGISLLLWAIVLARHRTAETASTLIAANMSPEVELSNGAGRRTT